MRIRLLGTMLLMLPLTGCCPCAPSAAPDDAQTEETKTKEAKTEQAEAPKPTIDYYGKPADIVIDAPEVPPEIMGPTPMDRLPKD
jgi:hypothetical protein